MNEFKCPCCSAAITFDVTAQKLKCPYCDTEFDIDTVRNYNADPKASDQDDMSWQTDPGEQWQEGEEAGLRVYVCQTCGGEIITDETTGATSCPYCGNPLVLKGAFSGDLKPDFVIPFKLTKEEAVNRLAEYYKGKKLLPKVFSSQAHLDEIKGCYVPYWLFDTTAEAHLRMKGTHIRSWRQGDYDYTETSYYSIIRGGTLSFDNVPADGATKMPDDLMESIEPFDMSQSVDFQTAYLAGFLANRYDVPAEKSVERVNTRIKSTTQATFRNTVSGYTSVNIESASIKLNNGKAKYALLPVWLLTTSWNGENYLFAMNGQTGKFVGNLPHDKGLWWKYFFLLLAGWTAVCGGILALILKIMGY